MCALPSADPHLDRVRESWFSVDGFFCLPGCPSEGGPVSAPRLTRCVRVVGGSLSGEWRVCDPVPVALLARCARVRGPSSVCPGSCLSAVAWLCNERLVMVMVIYSALVRSHQSTSAGSFGALCVPYGYDTHTQPCLKMWRGSPDLPTRSYAHFVVPRAHAARADGVDVVLFGKPQLALGIGVGGGGGLSARARCPRPIAFALSIMPFTPAAHAVHTPAAHSLPPPSSHPFNPVSTACNHHPSARQSHYRVIWWIGSSR